MPSTVPFAKLAPDAEVIVAPRIHSRTARNSRGESRSITSASQRSTGGRSGRGPNSQGGHRGNSRTSCFLRGIDKSLHCQESGSTTSASRSVDGLKIYVPQDVISRECSGASSWACVSIVNPTNANRPLDQQQAQRSQDRAANKSAVKPASKIVVKVEVWDEAPDDRHALLSGVLCTSLGVEGMTGDVIRLEPAPKKTPRKAIERLRIYPVALMGTKLDADLKVGGESKDLRSARVESFRTHFAQAGNNLLQGPITDGLLLSSFRDDSSGRQDNWILKFDLSPTASEKGNNIVHWSHELNHDYEIEVQPEILDSIELGQDKRPDDPVPSKLPALLGYESLMANAVSSSVHLCSLRICGGLGSGKTSFAKSLGHYLRRHHFFHLTYFNCRKLTVDEVRIPAIKELLTACFLRASWGARLDGRSLVIFDDLDKICPSEAELQVGSENERSRQISELFCSLLRRYCHTNSRIVVVATIQSKDQVNTTITGCHAIRQIIDLKAPDKDQRCKILQELTLRRPASGPGIIDADGYVGGDWMENPGPDGHPRPTSTATNHEVSSQMSFLELAGRTDGYMPGDLGLLVSRARNEALIKSIRKTATNSEVQLQDEDFLKALKGFMPASLRNVTLQSSTVKFDSIGGLGQTRKVLLETLQYPTTYAPIFAQCPLRLRSGLLLYGYPGCGKTLLASAIAGECGLNFISVKGPEILNKYIGASEKSIRDLFERAEAARPCILFFDEFDSIAPKRGHDSTGVTDRVVNQLLTQMDGAEGLSGVYVLAATSRPDLIDPALLRPGRLDKSLICDLPSKENRLDILLTLSKKVKLHESILQCTKEQGANLFEIASRTEGYSGADLQAVLYNAHLEAIHDSLKSSKGDANENTSIRQAANGSHHARSDQRNLLQFRFGTAYDHQEELELSKHSRPEQIKEKAKLVAKVETLKLFKQKQRAEQRNDLANNSTSGDSGSTSSHGIPEVVIEWKHLEASLSATRRSIGEMERRKLEAIYKEFLTERSGEMPNGQAPTEIGARSSLM